MLRGWGCGLISWGVRSVLQGHHALAERTKWGQILGPRGEGGRGAPFCSGHSFLQRKRPGYLEGGEFIREDLPHG